MAWQICVRQRLQKPSTLAVKWKIRIVVDTEKGTTETRENNEPKEIKLEFYSIYKKSTANDCRNAMTQKVPPNTLIL